MSQTPSHYDGDPAPAVPSVVHATDNDPFVGSMSSEVSHDNDAFVGTQPAEVSYPGGTHDSHADSLKGTAKDEAGKVADTGMQAAKDVAGTAKSEAANVLAETKQQAKSLFESVRSEVTSQSGAQKERLASGLQSIAQELRGLASGNPQSGQLTDLVDQAARKSGEFADWLEAHEPADLLREVQSFARRRPVAFLALCGLAGVVAGRIARGATAANTSLDSGSNTPQLSGSAPSYVSTYPPVTDDLGTGQLGAGDPLGTRYGDPVSETYDSTGAYDSTLGTADAGDTEYGSVTNRPSAGEMR